MAFTLSGRKRKAVELPQDGDSVYECIVVASTSPGLPRASKPRTTGSPPRSPLKDIVHNKRRRTLACVLIPKATFVPDVGPISPGRDLFHDQSGDSQWIQDPVRTERIAKRAPHRSGAVRAPGSSSRTTGLVQSKLSSFLKAPVDERVIETLSTPAADESLGEDVSEPHSRALSRSPTVNVPTRVPPPVHATLDEQISNGRPRRSKARLSYAKELLLGESSEDEFAPSVKLPKRVVNTQLKNNEDDLDFQVDEQSASADEDDAAEQIQFDDESSSEADEASEESDGLQEKPSKVKPRKAENGATAMPESTKFAAKSTEARKTSESGMLSLHGRKGKANGLDPSLPPLSDTADIFTDMTSQALKSGLRKAIDHLNGRPLRVVTMCSGTESPLLAMQMVRDALGKLGTGTIEVEHIFSAEIVPFKQAYIERNFAPPIIFRDITEFPEAFESETPMATTAYGARMPIPCNVDIVVAGTSCVDYSRQNAKRKKIEDGGESGKTWCGALAYCKKARPAIIIFENVQSADWHKMLDHYRKIGYDCEGVFVDSKDYYIPHTRRRGYMVCFNVNRLEKDGTGMGKKWQKLMESLKRFASSSVSDFLLPSDQVISRQQTREDDSIREVDWSQCEIRQMQYRQSERLGIARPFTQWQESGTMVVPERGSAVWYQRQVERVKDTIDCCILRSANRLLYDPRYKTAIWDLSQNIERVHDGRLGITGCILPTGIFFASDANRVLTGEEALRLQGIPLERISWTTESAREMFDLAGNAMTSTVIGSALLAAIISGHELVDASKPIRKAKHNELQQPVAMLKPSTAEAETFTYHLDDTSGLDVAAMLDRAKRSIRKCYCEGSDGLCAKSLQQCTDCDHTTCTTCGGSPVHNYYQSHLLNIGRLSPSSFAEELRSDLPLQLRFTGYIDLSTIGTGSDISTVNVASYRKVMESMWNFTYSFQRVRRTHCWTVSYVAAKARLDLVMEDDLAEWRLFAIPDKGLAINDWLRLALLQPVAKATISGSLFAVDWQWRVPVEKKLSLSVRGIGAVPTWWARSELPDHLQDTQAQSLEVAITTDNARSLERSLSGTYRYLPKCGKASDSLYRKVNEADERPLFLFLDPKRTGPLDEDSFVFSHNISDLELDETRPVLARIKAPWRPWPTKKGQGPAAARVVTGGAWEPARNLSLRPRAQELEMQRSLPVTMGSVSNTCSQVEHILSCSVLNQPHQESMADGVVDATKDSKFLLEYVWVLQAMKRQIDLSDWIPIPDGVMGTCCGSCAPARPQLRWKLERDKNVVKAYEDPESATAYERIVKSRRKPTVITAVHESGDRLTVAFGINIASMAHRAASRLPNGLGNIEAKWRLDTSNGISSASSFPRFTLQATEGVESFQGDLRMSISLFPNQRRVLEWMRKQELGVPSVVEEAEEDMLNEMRWRAEVRVSASMTIRGGICADHPGFGKTITSLALIQAQHLNSTGAKIRAGLAHRRDSNAAGLRCSSATLIVCPGTLMHQWAEEIKTKLGDTNGLLTVSTTAHLLRYSIEDFENAKIILVNRSVFSTDSYWERLAAFAATPGPATSSSKAFSQWLRFAAKQIPEHLRILQEGGLAALRKHISSAYRGLIDSDEFEAAVPSRRLRGKDYVAAKDKKKAQTQTLKAASSTVETKDVDRPLFEMFYFNRLIVDEFHQYEPLQYAAVVALQADKRWGLSGTPALNDFYDVSQLAGLIGVPLRLGSDARGIMKARNIAALRREMTDFERFDAMRQTPSSSIHSRIFELDQQFLDTFVRRNVMDFAEMKFEEILHPVTLDLDHRVMYTELSQHLNSLDMRIKRGGKKSQATDRDERLYRAVNTSETAEEALSKTATFLGRDMDAFARAGSGLEAAAVVREEEVDDLRSKLRDAIIAAESGEATALANWKEIRLTNKSLADDESIASIKEILVSLKAEPPGKAKKSKAKVKRSKDNDTDLDEADGEAAPAKIANKNPLTSAVNALSKRLVVAHRSLRYLHNVQRLQQHATEPKAKLQHCQSTGCHSDLRQGNDIAVSAFCGHIICRNCHKDLEELHKPQCPAPQCGCSMQPYHLLWKSKMGDLHTKQPCPYGAQLDKATDILESLRAQPAQDQAVLFVQYAEQLPEAKRALDDRQIPAEVVTTAGNAAAQIKRFQDNPNISVIVLNASDETAAGLNLQNANHVIFLSPLLRDSQYAYEATMAQAIGRVRRHGQKKRIFVHRIVALVTIDVDILEHRERRVDAITEAGAPVVTRPVAAAMLDGGGNGSGSGNGNGKAKRERTQLVRMGGFYSLQPHSWLYRCGGELNGEGEGTGEREKDGGAKVKGRSRVLGWEDFSSLLKFSRAYTEDDE